MADAPPPVMASAFTLPLSTRRAYYIHNCYNRMDFFSRETRNLFIKVFKIYFLAEESSLILRKKL